MPRTEPVVEVRRSRRRRSTVAAYREDGKVVVMIPARMSRAEERKWVEKMLTRLAKSERRRRPNDAALERRAVLLSEKYLDGKARPDTVRWVDNQYNRWGSCTPGDRAIRLSTRLRGMPAWVIDYVLVHELAHLLESGHTARFWTWVDRYPKAERAKGFLEGVALAGQLGVDAGAPNCAPDAEVDGAAAAAIAEDVG
ncbi:MAG: YgjP-like metallopeptidase domain-containing protein [Nocardioidaceae bacterium]